MLKEALKMKHKIPKCTIIFLAATIILSAIPGFSQKSSASGKESNAHAGTVAGKASKATDKVQKNQTARNQSAVKKAQDILSKLAQVNDENVQPPMPMRGGSDFMQRHRDWIEKRRLVQETIASERKSAIAQLELLGPEIADFLAQNLNSSSREVGMACSEALANIGKPAIQPIMNAILKKGKMPYATSALRSIGVSVIPPLTEILKTGNDDQRLVAAETLNSLIPENQEFRRRMRPNSALFTNSFNQLSEQFIFPTDSTMEIVKRVPKETSPKVRQLLIIVLGKVGPRNQSVVEVVTNSAKHDVEPQVRLVAIDSLGFSTKSQVDSAAAPSVRVLSDISAKDDIEDCRVEAIKVLASIDKCDDIRIPALLSALKDQNTDVLATTLDALGKMGARGKVALPDIKRVIEQNKSPEILSAAITAISKVGDDSTIPLVISFLSSDNHILKRAAVQALANYNEKAAQALDQLIPMLSTSDFSDRWAVINTIEKMGEKGKPAADALKKDVEIHGSQDRGFVQRALRNMGESLPPMPPKNGAVPQ